ncbi:MAG: hypothetical protein ACOY7U_06905 [Acidobacteriota bacterium]
MTARFTWILLVFFLAGCGEKKKLPTGPGGSPPDPNATFTRVLGEVFVPSCARSGCHAGQAPQAGLNLEPAGAYANVVNRPSTQRPELLRVAPFDPESSYLVKKIRGDPDIVGSPMPAEGNISAEARQLVVDWVRRGAPRD